MMYARVNVRGFVEGTVEADTEDQAAEMFGPCYNGNVTIRAMTAKRIRDVGPHFFEAEHEILIRLCDEVLAEKRREIPNWRRENTT